MYLMVSLNFDFGALIIAAWMKTTVQVNYVCYVE